MRALSPLLALIAGAATVVYAQVNTVNPNTPPNLLSELSPCALGCVAETAPMVGCSVFDIACQCSSKNITMIVTNCMIANCTVDESLVLVRVDAIQCNRPHDSKNKLVTIAGISAAVSTYALISLRVASRLWCVKRLWWDDWFHIASGVVTIPLIVASQLVADFGMGKHLYDVEGPNARKILFLFYLCQMFWATGIFLVKCSILCLYLRIFPSKRFRVVVLVWMGVLTVSTAVLVGFDIFQCVPVQAAFDLNIKNRKCYNLVDIANASAIINIITEIVILLLPIPVLKSLKVDGRKKLGLFVLFGAGVLVIAVAGARIPFLKSLADLGDATYNNAEVYLWSCAESVAVHIVAAAPAIRTSVSRLYHRGLGKYGDGTGATYGYSPSKAGTYNKEQQFGAMSGIVTTSTITKDVVSNQKHAQSTVEMDSLSPVRPGSKTRESRYGQHGVLQPSTTTTITAGNPTTPWSKASDLAIEAIDEKPELALTNSPDMETEPSPSRFQWLNRARGLLHRKPNSDPENPPYQGPYRKSVVERSSEEIILQMPEPARPDTGFASRYSTSTSTTAADTNKALPELPAPLLKNPRFVNLKNPT